MKRSPQPSPLISACLITKNEARYIEQCLASIATLVDEIVVYDTGSTDETVSIARSLGATVIEGYWDDDFGRARNESLDACTGQWVLQIDADEELVADTTAFRRGLESLADRHDALRVEIHNLDATGRVATIHKNPRLFRRTRCRWSGRLHERIVLLDGESPAVIDADGTRFLHHGYADAVVQDRQKYERNLRIADQELAAAEGASRFEVGLLKLNRARSLAALERCDDALEQCGQIFAEHEGMVRRSTIRVALELCLRHQRTVEARTWLERGAEHQVRADILEIFGGAVDLQEERRAPELTKYLGHGDVFDDDGLGISGESLDLLAALALASVEEWDVAATELYRLASTGDTFTAWEALAKSTRLASRDLVPVARLVPDEQVRGLLARLVMFEAPTADAFGHALVEVLGDDLRLVAFASFHAQRLTAEEALPWATLVRRLSGVERCPLLAQARDAQRPVIDRFTAALAAYSAFECAEGFELLDEAAAILEDDQLDLAQVLLAELSPELTATPI